MVLVRGRRGSQRRSSSGSYFGEVGQGRVEGVSQEELELGKGGVRSS